jgi:ferric-dicitrate binding protein FerR (iron transport regulator)
MITDPLLFRYLAGETTGPENRRIEKWLTDNPGNADHLDELRAAFESASAPGYEGESLSAWKELEAGMADTHKPQIIRINPGLSRFLKIAAVLLVMLGSGLIFLLRFEARVIRNNDLRTKSFFLSDGTEVYLGPSSRIITSTKFPQGHREVRLIGEAFFDVKPDPSHPFMVSAGETKVEVTGTRFFINASRKSDEVEVSVKSGQVLFYNSSIINKKAFRMGLGPGEMGIYSPTLNRMDKTRDPLYSSIP